MRKNKLTMKKIIDQTKKGAAALMAVAVCFSSCYKEDMQTLYSRQYVTPDLTKLIDDVNTALTDLRTGINNIENKEPISALEYVTKDGVQVGANITFGNKTVYVPFGTKGERGNPGDDCIITLGENGNWYINDKDSGKPWKGRKGETLQLGIKQAEDGLHYWTTKKTGDEEPTYLLNGDGSRARAYVIDGEICSSLDGSCCMLQQLLQRRRAERLQSPICYPRTD